MRCSCCHGFNPKAKTRSMADPSWGDTQLPHILEDTHIWLLISSLDSRMSPESFWPLMLTNSNRQQGKKVAVKVKSSNVPVVCLVHGVCLLNQGLYNKTNWHGYWRQHDIWDILTHYLLWFYLRCDRASPPVQQPDWVHLPLKRFHSWSIIYLRMIT